MSEPYLDFDPALLAEFIDESSDMLASLDSLFVQLEERPSDPEPVNAIFRPIHSIKGNSAFFGFGKVKSLAHEMESLLDKVRKKTITVTQPMISVLLEGVDALKAIFERARHGQPEVENEDSFKELVQRVKQVVEGGPDTLTVLNRAIGMIEELREKVTPLDNSLGQLATMLLEDLTAIAGPSNREKPVPAAAVKTGGDGKGSPLQRLEAILRPPLEGDLAAELVVEVKECLQALEPLAQDSATSSLVNEALDSYETFVSTVGFDSLLQEILLEKLDAMHGQVGWKQDAPAADAAPTPKAAQETPEEKVADKAVAPKHEQQKTMRISESHIDTFLAYVGELIVVGDMFRHLQTRIAAMNNATAVLSTFRHTSETFDTLSNNLQSSIMSIRKLPVRSLLQKTPRLVRDIATAKGKQINVELSGEEVEVDKSLTDLLDAPLTHMVRNAADHGIEMPRDRELAGKDPKGLIQVSVSEEANEIVLSVSDDGAGLDLEAIHAKAASMGIVKPDQQMRQSDIVNFIFSAGVSTAKEVSDVSGRGVGMDVVKSAIESSGGAITVSTEQGRGSVFRVTLPKSVTTQIIAGFLVEVASQCYVLQMNRVRETVSAHEEEIHSLNEKGLCLKRHGEIMPMVSLRGILGLEEKGILRGGSRTLVTIEAHKRLFAIEVDALLGVQQVVLRNILGLETKSGMIAGGALMGDGSVALVLDTDYIFDRRRKPEAHEQLSA